MYLIVQPPNHAMYNSNSFTHQCLFNVLGLWDCFPKRLKQKIQNIFRQKQEKRTAKAILLLVPPLAVRRTHKLWQEHVRLVWSEHARPFPAISFQVLNILSFCVACYIGKLQWKCWFISIKKKVMIVIFSRILSFFHRFLPVRLVKWKCTAAYVFVSCSFDDLGGSEKTGKKI